MTFLDQLVGAWLMDSKTSPQPDLVGHAPLDAPSGFTQADGFDGRKAVQLNSALGQFLSHVADDEFRFAADIGFTLAIRVKLTTVPTGIVAIIEQGTINSPGNNYLLVNDGSEWIAEVDIEVDATNKNQYQLNFGSAPVAGTWYLVVFGYDPATDTLFVSQNGAPKTTVGNGGGATGDHVYTEDFHVGTRQFFYASEFLNAAVDDLLLWKRVLTDAEIAQLRAGGTRGTFPFGYVLPSLKPSTPQICSASQCCDIDENYSAATNVGCSQDFIAPTSPNCTALSVRIDPPDGTMVQFPTFVAIFANRTDAVIHYTLDGSIPTANSPIYTGPFQITSPLPIKAIATLGTCDDSPVVTAQYITGDQSFLFSYRCDTPDLVGQWGVFAPNGAPDYHWTLHATFLNDLEITRIEIYQTDARGFWNSGQAWATDEFINPTEGPANFHVFPLEVWDTGVQLNAAYAAIFRDVLAGTYDWDLYGQPNAPTYGFFKIKMFTADGLLEQIIPTTCGDPPPPCVVPPAPVLNCECDKITVTFSGTIGHEYQIYRAVLPDCGDGLFRLLTSGTISAHPQSFVDTNVVPGCTYCYQFSEHFPDPCGWKTSVQACCSIVKVGVCDDSIMPSSVSISGFNANNFFGAAGNCLPGNSDHNLPQWNGSMAHTNACEFSATTQAFRFEGDIILSEASVQVQGGSPNVWLLSVVYANGGDSISLWTGTKTCGTTPLGTYNRLPDQPFGCTPFPGPATVGPATITLV